MDGVTSLWDAATDYFIDTGEHDWHNSARALAYVYDLGLSNKPWIIEEDTATAGSRIAIHDASMFYCAQGAPAYWYDDTNDTMPDKNFKFVYNLCTRFPQ